MKLALKEAGKNISRNMSGGPFGACIVKDDRVIAVSRNTVLKQDATCHAEVNAIRAASKKLKTYDLSGCVIYSTTEPCPMCFSAIHWAGIDTIIFGNTIADAKKVGFNELYISNAKMKKIGKVKMNIISGFMRSKVNQLYKKWNSLPNKKLY